MSGGLLEPVRLDTARGRFAGLRHARPGAPRLLALHGWLDNAASFVPMAPWLGGFDWLALDLAGHGQSDHRPPGGDYGLIDWLDDIAEVLDALGWDDCHLIGHSLGGALASMFAAACPARVRRLGLIEALGALPGTPGTALARLREALAGRRALAGKTLRVFPDLELAVRARMQANGLSPQSARLLVERGTRAVAGGHVWSTDPRLMLTSAIRATEPVVQAWLAGIEAPTLLVAAESHPPYFTPAQRDARLRCLRDGRSVVLAGGHHLHMETPQPVAAALSVFLSA